MFKRMISLVLVLTLLTGIIPLNVFATEPETMVDTDNVTIEGTNGFGTLLSQEIQESQEESDSEEEDYEGGYSVIDLTFEGTTATVEYSSLEESILVVAVYSEDGLQMLASGSVQVSPDEDLAYVTIEGDMPEYFLASAYLVDTYDLSPLCEAYDTPMYTQEMQELLDSTVNDYDQDRVLNLDENEDTNFAVYAETIKIIEYVDGYNIVASVDDENATYVIENADEQFAALQRGEVFAYEYGKNEILIAKVGNITVDGTTVTITGTELEIEEVFSHLKIKNEGFVDDLEIDESTVDGGLIYEGIEESNSNIQARTALDGNLSTSKSLKYTLAYTNGSGTKISGSVNFKIQLKIDFYISTSYSRFEVTLNPSASFKVEIKAGLKSDAIKLPMGTISFPFMYGAAMVKFTPSFVGEFTVSASAEATVKGTVGLYYDKGKNGSNFEPICKSSCDDLKLDAEGSLFLGLELTPKVEIIGGKVLEAKISAKIGAEATASPNDRNLKEGAAIRHGCEGCLDGDLSLVVSSSASLKFLGKHVLEKLTSTTISLVNWKVKFADFYICYEHGTYFALGTCPNTLYRTTVVVTDKDDNPISNAKVTVGSQSQMTDQKGVSVFYLPCLEYDLCTTYGELTAFRTVMANKAQKVKVKLLPDGTSEDVFDFIIPDDIVDDTIVYISGKCGDDLFWNLDNKGRLMISGTGPMWNYDYEDAPWYSERSSITEVWFGRGFIDEVTSIGDHAFEDCTNLTSVVNADSVTSIGEGAFYNCTSLSSMKIPDSMTTIGNYAFEGCTSLTSVTIPNSVTTIGAGAFIDCTSLTSVTIPYGVTTIRQSTFLRCESLISVIIPNSVTAIGNSAFRGCTNLTSVTIPDNVTTIGHGIFGDCESLTSVIIPDSVTTIGISPFENCANLTKVTIGNSVTTIHSSAFNWCDSLTEIIFCGDAPFIESAIFGNALTDVNLIIGTVYYPAGNSTWTSDVMKACGGYITWVPYTLDENGNMILNEAATVTVEAEETTELTDALVLETAEESAQTRLDLSAEDIEEQGETVAPYAVYDGEYSTVVTDTYTLKTASFSGLVPGEQYVLLAMVSIDVEDPLAADNLLYIDQAAASEDGTLVFQYVQRTTTDTSYVVACGASNKDLNDAEITFPKMIADGEVQTVNPIVVYNGKTLTEGQDYTIQGSVSFTDAGTYTCYIRGIRNYTGLVECTYIVANELASGYSGDIEWTLSADGVLTFFGNGEMGEYATSEETGGYALVGGQPWLNQGIEITSVVIEEGVTSVGSGAFVDLTTLTSVTFPQTTLTCIEPYAFYCSGLSDVIIPDSVTIIGEGTFKNCTNLTSVSIGNSVTTIGRYAFAGCSNLSNVEIPDSLTTISYGTFMDCTNLASVTIGNGVTTIENCVFYGCSNLISVIFGCNLEKLGIQLFEGCACLSEITFRGDAPTIRSSTFKSVTATAYYPANNPTWTTAVLQNYGGTITWEGYICTDHSYEAIVTKPTCTEQGYTTYICSICSDSYVDSYVDDLGHDYSDGTCTRCGESDPNYESPTFGSCGENLTWTLSDGVLTISGTGSMTDYPSSSDVPWNIRSSLITTVNIGDSVTTIGDNAFFGCTNLTSVEIPDNVTSIGYSAFENCTSLTNVEIPDSVITIGSGAFKNCTNLTSMSIGNSVTTIGDDAFYDCTSLVSVAIPDSVITIDRRAFYGCTSLTSVEIGNGVDAIEDWVFANCKSLTSVTIGNGVTFIGYYAFYGCSSLASVTIPDSVITIYDCAFRSCVSLTSVEIPDSVTSIRDDAFYDCKSLTSVRIPDSVAMIGDDAFYGCSSLTGIYVDENNSIYSSDGQGVLFNKEKTQLLLAPSGISGSYNIPNSVTVISDYAFKSCDSLTSVVIPNSVTTICSGAFRFCDNLKKITFTGDVPVVSETAFAYVEASAYYPSDNLTWTEDIRQNYGGTITWIPYDESSGITVSGTVTSYNDSAGKVTVELIDSTGIVAYLTTVTGNSASYTLSNVAAGTYTMNVSKANHASRSYTVVVEDTDLTQNAKICLRGDVTGDGKITATDYSRLLAHVKKTNVITDEYTLQCADVTGEGKITATDYSRLLAHVKKVSLLW